MSVSGETETSIRVARLASSRTCGTIVIAFDCGWSDWMKVVERAREGDNTETA